MNLRRFGSCLLSIAALILPLSAQTNTTTIAGNNSTGDAAVLSLYDTSADHNWNLHMLDASNTGRFAISKGVFGGNDSEFLTILPSGNVGIGTPIPDTGTKLQVTGGILTSAAFSSTIGGTGGMDYFSTGLRLFSMGVSGSTKGTFMFYAKGADNSSSIPLVIDSAGNVGVGVTNPTSLLANTATNRTAATDGAGVAAGGATWATSGGYVMNLNNTGTGGSSNGLLVHTAASSVYSYALAIESNSTSRFVVRADGNVGIGTTNPTQKLFVNGTIQAKEVVVQAGWSDYVFDESYKLKALSEVEAYVKAEKHLPGVPSAAQVAKEGIPVGDMQSKLLAKIEELTLHAIRQEKEIQLLKEQLHLSSR